MAKKLFFVSVLLLTVIMLTCNLSAQEIVGLGDGIGADSAAVDNDVDEVIEIVDGTYAIDDDIEIDSVVMAEHPIGNVTDAGGNRSVKKDGNRWMIHSLYFMDMKDWKIRAKFRKELNAPRWYYYEPVYVDDYEVLSDAAQPFLMLQTFESDDVAKTFTFCGDSIRIYRCGDYPKESPKYSLLIVTKKEGR